MLSLINFVCLLVILVLLVYFFVMLVRISSKINDLSYYVHKPTIPFQEKADFPYVITTPSKNLL